MKGVLSGMPLFTPGAVADWLFQDSKAQTSQNCASRRHEVNGDKLVERRGMYHYYRSIKRRGRSKEISALSRFLCVSCDFLVL